jgi:transcription initiation factor TFIIH subunit 3
MDDDVHPSLLALIVEANPASWRQLTRYGTAENLVDGNELVAQITLFCHSYALMHRSNRILVIANHPNESVVVYPRRQGATGGSGSSGSSSSRMGTAPADDDFVPACHTLQKVVAAGLRYYMSEESVSGAEESSGGKRKAAAAASSSSSSSSSSSEPGSSLSQALSTALCVINRQLQLHPKLQPRVAVVQLSKDVSTTYNAIMNSIFSAQKLGVVVDGVVLSRDDSRFLQQACLLTGGVYQKPTDQRNFLQLMTTHILPSTHSRRMLRAPLQKMVDFRASCFCHRKPVEFAFMCSVCLALTCEPPTDVCTTCGTAARK